MVTRWLERHPLAVFLAITTIGLVIWLSTLVMFWLLLRIFQINTSLWPMIEALSTAVAAAAVLGAAFVASRELSEFANARHIEIADRLFDELNSQENIEARRWIFQYLPDDPAEGVSSMTPKGQDAVKRVLNSLDRIAFLTQSDWIPEDMIMTWMNPMIVKTWIKLGPYVEFESVRRGEPEYYVMACRLAQRCIDWRAKHLPGARVIWLDDAL